MTDLKARKEWCEPVPGGRDPLTGGLVPNYRICPPSVVSALLDAYEFVATPITGCRCVACEIRRQQRRDDLLAAVEAAITRALEQKP